MSKGRKCKKGKKKKEKGNSSSWCCNGVSCAGLPGPLTNQQAMSGEVTVSLQVHCQQPSSIISLSFVLFFFFLKTS